MAALLVQPGIIRVITLQTGERLQGLGQATEATLADRGQEHHVAVFGRFGEQPLRRLLCRQELSTLDQRADSQHLGFDPGSWSIEAGG